MELEEPRRVGIHKEVWRDEGIRNRHSGENRSPDGVKLF